MNEFVLTARMDPGKQTDRRKIQQRQSGTFYVSANGTMSNDCTMSPIYAVNNGVLTATVHGTVYTYSTTPGVAYEMFAPSTIAGSITMTFSLGSGGTLNWLNSAFWNGQAGFCSVQNGTIYAVFQQNGQPDGCLYIQLSLFAVSSCQGLSYSTVTGPPGAQGSQGPTGFKARQALAELLARRVAKVLRDLQEFKARQCGVSGAVGATGATGPSGAPGPSATAYVYGYLGCYVQTGTKTSTTGLALTSYQATYTSLIDSTCMGLYRGKLEKKTAIPASVPQRLGAWLANAEIAPS
ncbi:hypothetical protein B0A55_00247 [Friedmanniomyces simplex]|uniref:DUF7908 domain-containing protein n=1 Tax=Friedmanniomyces simplex TaxID=329884 RepID=A0A4U0Y878_9PEZI|nr:hypothetical protein B0A55_00247 [Friedmanniomyces simplex]